MCAVLGDSSLDLVFDTWRRSLPMGAGFRQEELAAFLGEKSHCHCTLRACGVSAA